VIAMIARIIWRLETPGRALRCAAATFRVIDIIFVYNERAVPESPGFNWKVSHAGTRSLRTRDRSPDTASSIFARPILTDETSNEMRSRRHATTRVRLSSRSDIPNSRIANARSPQSAKSLRSSDLALVKRFRDDGPNRAPGAGSRRRRDVTSHAVPASVARRTQSEMVCSAPTAGHESHANGRSHTGSGRSHVPG